MYCPHCGAWNPDESNYCGKCGRHLERSKRRRWSFGPVTVLALVLILALGMAIAAGILARDRLIRAWRSLVAEPTQVAVIPTITATQVPVRETATPTALPSPSPSPTEAPTITLSPTPTQEQTPTPRQRTFKLVYRECVPHGLSLGSVKGQVFDKAGNVIPGAKVRITINGYEWQSDANPATTNSAGWYEWILEVRQKVQFVELIVGGISVPFSPQGFEVEARGSCFQRVDFVEQ